MKKDMVKHLKILGCLFIARSVLLFVIVFAVKKYWMIDSDLVSTVLIIVGIIALGDIMCGYGLLTKQPWGRILGLIMSFSGLCSLPIGTALSIYGMWTLFDEDTIVLLNSDNQP
jgi:hypothetical protein